MAFVRNISRKFLGSHKVTLAIYSGRPNPVWTVAPSHHNFKEIKAHVDNAKAKGNIYRHEHMPACLGFTGFLVHRPDEEEHGHCIIGKETAELQMLLLDTMPGGVISCALRAEILKAIRSGAVSPRKPDKTDAPPKEENAETIQCYAPALNLPRWNKHHLIRTNNNCYNYANNTITNSFAQPGYASGCPIGPGITPAEVLQSSESDGLLKMDVPPSAPPPGAPAQPNCLVALVVAAGIDYHWYRLDNNGFWSHKPGKTAATNKDAEGNLITDPRKAANSTIDYKFVSFMQIFTNIIDGPYQA